MNIGYFEKFKGEDSVLLDGTTEEISRLSTRLQKFAESSESMVLVHEGQSAQSEKGLQLYAIKEAMNFTQSPSGAFGWLCSPNEFATITENLLALVERGVGHQYFPLVHSNAQLVISVGEYGENWWKRNG